MIKNAVLFRIAQEVNLDLAKATEGFESNQFTPCTPNQEMSCGWASPRGVEHGALIESIEGQWIARLVVEVKKVPGDAVKLKLEEKVAQVEAATGRKPGRKEKRELKETIEQEILPTVIPKRFHVTAWISPKGKFIVVDASSLKKSDVIITALIKSIDGLALSAVSTAKSPSASMATWLSTKEWPESINGNRACVLQASDESKAKVKYDNHELEIEEIQRHIEGGKMPKSMSLEWNGRVSFTLTDGLVLKKIAFLDVKNETTSKEQGADAFDADVVLTTGELEKLIPDLIDAMGGEAVTGSSKESEEHEEEVAEAV